MILIFLSHPPQPTKGRGPPERRHPVAPEAAVVGARRDEERRGGGRVGEGRGCAVCLGGVEVRRGVRARGGHASSSSPFFSFALPPPPSLLGIGGETVRVPPSVSKDASFPADGRNRWRAGRRTGSPGPSRLRPLVKEVPGIGPCSGHYVGWCCFLGQHYSNSTSMFATVGEFHSSVNHMKKGERRLRLSASL